MADQTFPNHLLVQFLELKQYVLSVCDEDPTCLYELAKNDPVLRRYCASLSDIAELLEEHAFRADGGIVAPGSRDFIIAWKDFGDRWRAQVSDVSTYNRDPAFAELTRSLSFEVRGPYEDSTEKVNSERQKKVLSARLTELEAIANEFDEDSDQRGYLFEFERMLVELYWSTSFSLDGACERAKQVPLLLVPPNTAKKVSSTEVRSLYVLWNEARKAYILGVPLASMAVSRAVLETLLNEVHRVPGADLSEKIDNATRRDRHRMHKLRQVGNAVLHGLGESPIVTGKKAMLFPSQEALRVLADLREIIEAFEVP